ncbi:MAG: chemotaxis protein CheA [Proteobacteria bacterium]|nr:chemotaxis protein CheA [Pseudomonadota bacterium]
MDPMEAIKQTYFQECEELLLAMEEGLIAIQSGEADSEVINAVFRAVHSIKGGGGAFGFENLVAFAHIFETVLDHLRSGTLAADEEVATVLLRAGDVLADHVQAARNGEILAAEHDREIKQQLETLSGKEGGCDAAGDFDGIDFKPAVIALDDLDPAAQQGWRIHFAPHAALYAKANEPALLVRELATLGETAVTSDLSRLPALDVIEPDQAYFAWDIVLKGDIARDKIEEVFEFVVGDCELDIQPLETPAPETPEGLDVETMAPQPEVAAGQPEKKEAHAAAEAAKQTIRVDLDKVDRLVNLVGELVITQAMLSQRVAECKIPRSSPIGDGLNELEHLLRELQESVMAIRTQPVKSVFQRMPRLVRELAAQTNKKVRLVVEGEGTEVDKTVIERLGEPLTHMIRNAVDHGLETPDERAAAGKPEEGTVTLSAEHRGGRIVIEVSDDGRGINRARVREKAIERELIAASAQLSDEEIDNLIFMPGFSTASQVSNISGRGVGMDVVRRNIVDLGGRITIGSAPKSGSRFSLTLPLTLAVLDGMVVAVGDQTFVLPLAHIIESLKPQPQDIRPFGHGRHLLNVRGAYVPLVQVSELMGIKGAAKPLDGVVILVESQGTGRLALVVDAILGQHQVVIKSFEGNYRHIDGIAAATILGDGRVALILDVDGLVGRCRSQLADAELQPTGT